jgi:multiple sugar transport system permease protein
VMNEPKWVGLRNYQTAFNDPLTWTSLGNTAYYVFLSVPIGITLSLCCALLMNRQLPGLAGFRSLFYVPSVVPTVVTTFLWIYLLQPEFGLVNSLLRDIGVQGPRWLGSAAWAKPSLIIMALWASAGGATMIVFLAGLQAIPTELYEAAEVDGAGSLRKFWSITLPLLSPTTFFNLIVGIIAAFKVFASAYVSTGGGPGDATRFFVLHLFQKAFTAYLPGLASALAWILFVVILAFTLLQFWVARRWVYYESSSKDVI